MNQGYIHLDHLEMFVLDEADRMLDMGFIHDVKKIIRELPPEKQTLLFSATMPPQIEQLVASLLKQPVKIEVAPVSSTAETITQSVFFVHKSDKQSLLEHIIKEKGIRRTLVFARTKHGADKVAKELKKAEIRADAIHGNKTQSARQNALSNFKTGRLKVLVATDIAARGIDVDDLTHVINFDLPNIPETYVHRIGRTGRAGNNGTALSFCDSEEREYLKDINKLIGLKIPAEAHPFEKPFAEEKTGNPAGRNGFKKQGPRDRRPLQNKAKNTFHNRGN